MASGGSRTIRFDGSKASVGFAARCLKIGTRLVEVDGGAVPTLVRFHARIKTAPPFPLIRR